MTQTVLYIEDNEMNVRLAEKVLARIADVELVVARTGSEGVQTARDRAPDLVLLDLHLPDMHGSDVLEELDAATPVLVVSADASPAEIERLRAAGVAGYLTKPIDVPELLMAVRNALAGAAR